MSVFRRLRSDCEVDAVCTNPPRTRPLGTVTSLSTSAPRPKHFVGRVRAEEPDPEDPEDPGDPASSPSLLDERMKIDSQMF